MKEIVRLPGVPHDIITDRGTLFTSDLWKETRGRLGIEWRLSTTFHLQTNKQTERTNTILKQYLSAYINYQQQHWSDYLPLAECVYNNRYLDTIKITPFFTNYGTHPEYEIICHLIEGMQTIPEEITLLHESLRNEMVAAQLRQSEYYDLHRKADPNLQSGYMVWLLPRNTKTTRPSKKPDHKKIGHFKILAKIGTRADKLALPPSMAIHNTFHISLLEPYQDNLFPTQIKEPLPSIQVEGEEEYELDKILDWWLHYKMLEYRAMWKGYSPEHDKVWYPPENFNHAEHAIQRFHRRYPGRPAMVTHHDGKIVLRTSPRRQSRTTLTYPDGQRPARRPPTLPPLAQTTLTHQEGWCHMPPGVWRIASTMGVKST